MQFHFISELFGSGFLAFTGVGDPSSPGSRTGGPSPLLLVTDAGHDAVHVIDVVGQAHAGYVAAPGSISGPRGVATRGSLAAVSAWKCWNKGAHVVHVFEGAGAVWEPLRIVGAGFGPGDGQLSQPYGLRFTADGEGIAVADHENNRVSAFLVADGSFVEHVVVGVRSPRDVAEVQGGWLVASHASNTVVLASQGLPALTLAGDLINPTALALAPGPALFVRELGVSGHVHVFK
jgi:DNA-binding beta-propeller fold protein YncE